MTKNVWDFLQNALAFRNSVGGRNEMQWAEVICKHFPLGCGGCAMANLLN